MWSSSGQICQCTSLIFLFYGDLQTSSFSFKYPTSYPVSKYTTIYNRVGVWEPAVYNYAKAMDIMARQRSNTVQSATKIIN